MAHLLVLLSFLLPALPASAERDPYRRVSKALSDSAGRASVRTVAVLPFASARGEDEAGGLAVSEKLVTSLVQESGLEVIERTLLEKVVQEQGLSLSGALAPRQAQVLGKVLGVDAVITGTLLPSRGAEVELNARLIHAGTARILGAASAQVPRDWGEAPAKEGWGRWSVPPPPDLGEGAPVLWAPSREGGCADWEESLDRLQAESLDLKARYWAANIAAPGFDAAKLRRNPGTEIRSMELRYRFYARLKELYYAGVKPLTVVESNRLKLMDREAEELERRCLK